MTHSSPSPHETDLRFAIDAAVNAHGAPRVLFAALLAVFKPPPGRRRRCDDRALNAHLRRDIGLPPAPGAQRDWTRHL